MRPAIPDPPYEGGCLCGQARYALNARPLALNACHCDDCKKLSGATNLLMLLALRDKFRHPAEGLDRFRKRADSGREVDILRCANCGTRLWHEPLSAPNLVFIAAGTLDDSRWVVPTSHIWTDRANPTVRFEEDALKVALQPVERRELLEAFDRVYAS